MQKKKKKKKSHEVSLIQAAKHKTLTFVIIHKSNKERKKNINKSIFINKIRLKHETKARLITLSPSSFPYFYLSQKISIQNILNIFYFLYTSIIFYYYLNKKIHYKTKKIYFSI